MAVEQKIRDTASTKAEQSDILLLMNMDTKSIRVASGENGTTDRFDKINQENQPFLKIERSNTIENFLSKYFFSQNKDPTNFRFFRAPLADVKQVAPNIRELFKENPSNEMQDFFRKHEVSQTFDNKIDNKSKKIDNFSNNHSNNIKKMDTNQKVQTDSTVKSRFNEALIDWNELKNFGLSREYLDRSGLLEPMLKGQKTNKLVPVKCNFGSAQLKTDARLGFMQTEGKVVLSIYGMRKEPELEKPYFGHIFSEEDKKNLKESGNMGRLANFTYPSQKEKVPCFISIDKLTNEVISMPAGRAFIPDEVSNVKLTDFEKEQLREGKPVLVEGMISKNGKEFDAHLQINADKRGLEYIFPDRSQMQIESIGGVELTKKQQEDYNSGKAIFVEDMQSRYGNDVYSSFVKKDANGNPSYTRYNPDSPEGAREIYIPKEICGTELTTEDKNELRAGKVVFLKDMVSRSGEEFSSFVKADTETGKISFSKTQDGFDEKPTYKIPQEIWGVTLKTTERAALQDGKAIYLKDMTGVNGKQFSSWIKLNENKSKLDYYNENPDLSRQNAKSQTTQTTGQDKKQAPEKQTQKQLEKDAKEQAKRDMKAQKTSSKRKL